MNPYKDPDAGTRVYICILQTTVGAPSRMPVVDRGQHTPPSVGALLYTTNCTSHLACTSHQSHTLVCCSLSPHRSSRSHLVVIHCALLHRNKADLHNTPHYAQNFEYPGSNCQAPFQPVTWIGRRTPRTRTCVTSWLVRVTPVIFFSAITAAGAQTPPLPSKLVNSNICRGTALPDKTAVVFRRRVTSVHYA